MSKYVFNIQKREYKGRKEWDKRGREGQKEEGMKSSFVFYK